MGLKDNTTCYDIMHYLRIKSDQNGIESHMSNRIVSIYYTIKSDQNGIESYTHTSTQTGFLLDKIRP